MDSINCDFSPLKENVEVGMKRLIHLLQANLQVLGNENHCVLGGIEDVKKLLNSIEATAASYYLNCYLASFTDTYEELSITVQHLSKQNHGALIVVERSQSIEPMIQKGTSIGATVSSKLLESFFYPGNPLHDGAVLIRENVVVSAANVLPLSKKVYEGRKLGTRHRAALGISEQSDALALVVSEESGNISFAIDGNLYPINTFQPSVLKASISKGP
ncbi:sporulation-specific diadenylate cyclase CdaS [Bacillus marasmi]|uniref:sporulation-specific diadenylate cyclase CdaS n=1 Tax=Bacillus marasmi TaxID=1926279 RepID=UPI0011C8AF08|nr:sporulation-specific diadenylate cyclase CdaS [Bacillus marasmi]